MAENSKKSIRTLSLEELQSYFESIGEKKYRVKQVWEWMWQKHAHTFEDMSNLSKELRQKLSEEFSLPAVKVDTVQYSSDGTVKARFKTFDNEFAEGVLIPADSLKDGEASRQTACVSSQIGCSLSCKFCATGYMDKKRNLTAEEIFDEVVLLNQLAEKAYGRKLTNVVFMGMGEPLLNYKQVTKAIERITAQDGLGMGARRITVSTAGVAKMMV
jgi:23S rRNA (adenine2503-C2)-methyltransferase